MAEAIKGLNIKLGLDTTELEASIKSLNSDLKEQQRDLAAINKNLNTILLTLIYGSKSNLS